MYGVLALSLFIGSIFLWRYVAKKFFAKGRGKPFTYFMSTAIAFFALSFSLAIIAPLNPNPPQKKMQTVETKVDDTAKKEQDFKEDQKMVLDYLNTIHSTMLFVDEILEEHKQYLSLRDISRASSLAEDCAVSYKGISEDFLMGKFRAPMLHNKDMKETINKSAFEYSTLYRLKTRYCENFIKYINTRNNSALESAKFDTNEILNQSVVATASTFSIGEKYNLKYQDKKWVVLQ
jgi:hypothetical protein